MASSWQLRYAVHVLSAGGVIAYPTEAVYGLGCDPLNAAAFQRLLSIKRRRIDKGVILVAADWAQLWSFVQMPDNELRQRIDDSWPGFVTWLMPARSHVPGWLTGGRPTLAVRLTAHLQTSALCKLFGGPVVSSSANMSGRSPARTALAVRRRLAHGLDFILPGAIGGATGPSEIRDALTGRVVRAGVGTR
jgi:L-threonylcarbamoyladenylate synthase